MKDHIRSERHAALEAYAPAERLSYRIGGYRPLPAVRVNWLRRAVRWVVGAMT